MSYNPAGGAETRKRIPMSVPQLRLSVPDIPGYHLHWMRGDPARLMQAQRAGYEFVDMEEVMLNNLDLGGSEQVSGNTDMGTRVSQLASPMGGAKTEDGQPLRLYLMKLKEEYYLEDQKEQEKRSDSFVSSMWAGSTGSESDLAVDKSQRYVDRSRTSIPDFFKRKAGKAR